VSSNTSGVLSTGGTTTGDIFGQTGSGTTNYPGSSGPFGISQSNPFYNYYASPLIAGYADKVPLLSQNSYGLTTSTSGTSLSGNGIFGTAMTNSATNATTNGGGFRDLSDLDKAQELASKHDKKGLLENIVRSWTIEARSAPTLLYDRPSFTGDSRVFGDLVWYATGMNTAVADIQAVLEAEAVSDPAPRLGSIDDGARKLIEQVRAAGWSKLTVAGEGRQPAYAILFNGSGHFTWQRVLPCGLREQVICDGSNLWHLYPEIGLGAKRAVSRFHRAEFNQAVPWLVPPVTDLARGADVKLIDASIIALVPHDSGHLRDEQGKQAQFLQIQLVFGEGRLTERQLVLMPARVVLCRQRYGADGTITVEGTDKATPPTTVKLEIASAQAPDLKPRSSELVVVPMPLRTLAKLAPNFVGDSTKVDADLAISMVATNSALQLAQGAMDIVSQRFFSRGDRRLGFYVLLASAGAALDPMAEVGRDAKGKQIRFNVLADHPRVPLAYYLAYHFLSLRHNQQMPALGDIGGPADGFIQRVGQFRDHYAAWQTRWATQGNDEARTRERDKTLQFIGKSPLPAYDWALLDEMHRSGLSLDVKVQEAVTAAYKKAGDSSGLAYSVRYDLALAQWNAGHAEEARKQWRKLFQETLQTGALPPIERQFREALMPSDGQGPTYAVLMRDAASLLARRGQRLQILLLAWQAQQLGDLETGNDMLVRCLESAQPGIERSLARLAAVRLYGDTRQLVRADTMLKLVLADEPFSKSPSLWRLAAQLAVERKALARAADCLEQALDLEYRDLPPIVNLQSIRNDYGQLLAQYEQVANALTLLEKTPPREFVAKVVHAADRWRALDPEPTQVCQMTAAILQAVGAKELAWDYLTTPAGLKPNEAAPWVSLAQWLQKDGYLDLADKAFGIAYDAEPTNAQILWDRAQNLLQAGRGEDARAVYRVLAESSWQPRFQGLQNEAKQLLNIR
jgi:predicted Zn-dependent protease